MSMTESDVRAAIRKALPQGEDALVVAVADLIRQGYWIGPPRRHARTGRPVWRQAGEAEADGTDGHMTGLVTRLPSYTRAAAHGQAGTGDRTDGAGEGCGEGRDEAGMSETRGHEHARDLMRLYAAACPGRAGTFGGPADVDMLVASINDYRTASDIEALRAIAHRENERDEARDRAAALAEVVRVLGECKACGGTGTFDYFDGVTPSRPCQGCAATGLNALARAALGGP
jgi:hypothetical protein